MLLWLNRIGYTFTNVRFFDFQVRIFTHHVMRLTLEALPPIANEGLVNLTGNLQHKCNQRSRCFPLLYGPTSNARTFSLKGNVTPS